MIGRRQSTAAMVDDRQPRHCLCNARARFERDPGQLDVERSKIGGFTLPFGKALAGLLDRPAVEVDAEIDERADDAEEKPVDVAERIVRVGIGASFFDELLGVDPPAFDEG